MLTTMPDTLWVGVTVGYYYCRCCCYLQIQVVPTNQKYINTKKKKEQKYFFFESWLSTGHWEEKNVDRFIPRSNFKEGGSVKALIRKK